jgi:GxxExxY protein
VSINLITEKIIASAITVHQALGPGLLESAYQKCLAIEFRERELSFEEQVWLSVKYRGHEIRNAYRMDFVVAGQVVVEVKAIEKLSDIEVAQVLTYLKLSGYHVGLIFNFKVPVLSRGIRRIVLNLREDSATPRLGG